MDFELTETLLRLWWEIHHLADRLGWEELARHDAVPTVQVLVPLAIAILLMPVVVRWSGSLLRLTVICLALLVPVWLLLPAP